MLTSVLLHMVEAARPVDDAPRRAELDWTLHQVQNPAVVAIDDVDDASGAEDAGIERLATGGRIERVRSRTACQMARTLRHCVNADHRSIELAGVGVVIVEAFGHECPPITGSATPASANPFARRRQLSHRRRARQMAPGRSNCG